MAFPLFAIGFLVLTSARRVAHVEYVSGNVEWGATEPLTGPPRPERDADWQTQLIVPDHDSSSYEWLDQTREMFARREWRVRHVDYENAPFGHEVSTASPYRWWLGAVAWLDHVVYGRGLGASVERAALFSDPLLHVLFLAGTAAFVAWQFGIWPAVLLSIGLAVIFPFAAGFLPGTPSDQGLVRILAFWSVLPLLAGARAAYSTGTDAARRARGWFFMAGLFGGLGLWIGVAGEIPILGGIALGALIAAAVSRGDTKPGSAESREALPWLSWALGGASASLAAYLIEFFPAHLGSWELRINHPLYGLAWLGAGAVLARAVTWIERGRFSWSLRETVVLGLAVAALAAVPVVMRLTHDQGFLEADLAAFRLTRLPGELREVNLWTWLVDEFFTPKVWATLLPLLLVLPAGALILLRRTGLASRASLAIALGPVFAGIGLACWQLRWWNQADAILLALLVAATVGVNEAFTHRFSRWIWVGFLAPIFVLGAIQIVPAAGTATKNVLEETEFLGLIERDLARWLAGHAGTRDVTILAPHDTGATLYYYGGLRGLATLGWENRAGLEAAVRIVSASTPEEAKELIDRRGITFIVIPSWDPYLDSYARMGMGQVEGTALKTWHDWNLPAWLRPVPYQLPGIAGFEGQSVAVLEVVEEQESAEALSRIAEYFVEMQQLDLAVLAGQALRRYPADLGALTARAQVEIARGDATASARTVELLQRRLANGADRGLPWDRRVSLAIVLARSKHMDLAREQVRLCLAEVDEAKLRSLTTESLYRLHVLWKACDLAIPDQRLRALGLDLLPAELRRRL